ncbi:MAG TPA: XrtA system polysaccharide deacetylase [Myxococcota bacterium]|nr:XrtA system polysaccharide deacetylase [Myxococcota bacterium]
MSLHALSVDLEEHFQVANFDGLVERARWGDEPSRVDHSARRLLDAFEEHGRRATFFVLGWVAERRPALVREIAARGHEIACHGFGHELVYEIGPERFREDLKRARAAIEDAAGARVEGYRAPSFSITQRSLWALEILAEEGFRFDSSIFPVRHYRYGIPDFEQRPVELRLPNGLSIREFPLTTLDVGPVRLPLAGGAYLRFLPPSIFRWGLCRLADAREPSVLYLHPWEIDHEQPRLPTGWRVRVNHYHNLHRTLERVRALLERFAFEPVSRVLEHLAGLGRLPVRELAPARVAAA